MGGCGIPVQAGLQQGNQGAVPRRTGTGILLIEHRHGVSVHLRLLLFERNKPYEFCDADRHYRHGDSDSRRTDYLPCRIQRGRKPRQRSVADIHHSAKRLPGGFRGHSCCGISGGTVILYSPVAGGSYITDFPP